MHTNSFENKREMEFIANVRCSGCVNVRKVLLFNGFECGDILKQLNYRRVAHKLSRKMIFEKELKACISRIYYINLIQIFSHIGKFLYSNVF